MLMKHLLGAGQQMDPKLLECWNDDFGPGARFPRMVFLG